MHIPFVDLKIQGPHAPETCASTSFATSANLQENGKKVICLQSVSYTHLTLPTN